MKARVVYSLDVYETKEYEGFNTFNANRELNESNIKKISDSLSDTIGNKIPIIVDADMVIIDGQHRLEACRRKGSAVKFIISNEYVADDIRVINSASKSWTKDDYIKYNAIHNMSPTYNQILELVQDYNTSSTVVCEALCLSSRQIETCIEKSDFDFNKARTLLSQFSDIMEYIKKNTKGKRLLIKTIKKLNRHSRFNYSRLMDAMDKYCYSVVKNQHISSEDVALGMLVEIYNKGCRGDNRLDILELK